MMHNKDNIMKSCFNSPMRITQMFGEDFYKYGKLYYQSMGLKGHDGLDVVPTDSDWRIYNIIPGIVVILEKHRVYGNRIGILNEYNNIIEYHNHLEKFHKAIKIGDRLGYRVELGIMGKTGKVFGAHNHLGYAKSNIEGIRIHRDNGYFGYIDPLPLLKD